MKISNNLRDVDRHYLQNLLQSGQGELPDKEGRISKNATHKFLVSNGFIVGAEKVIHKEKNYENNL